MLEDGSRDLSRTYCKNEHYIEESRCCFTPRRADDPQLFCCRCAHKRRASPLTCLTICFLVLTYNLLGGFLFLAIEGSTAPHEETAVAASKPNLSRAQDTGTDLRTKTVERLWSITEDLNILYKENWTKLAAKELMDFQKVLMKSMKGEVMFGSRAHLDRAGDYRWTFSTSFLYALTLITTIGHGNVTPKSSAGKMVAVVYACVGIPIIMVYLSTVGETLARSFRALYSRLQPGGGCLRRGRGAAPDKEPSTPFQDALNLHGLPGRRPWPCREHTRVPVALSLLLVALYLALGSLLFRTTERWPLLDGCYFSFSSLATIGFGELRPGLQARAVSARAEDAAVGACCLYILVGIVVVAMCFDLIQEEARGLVRGVAGLCAGGGRAVHSGGEGAAAAGGAGAPPRPPQVSFTVDALHSARFSSLPRRRSGAPGDGSFRRGSPAAAGSGRCLEYFVPRSLSEFDLSAVGALTDLAVLGERARAPRAPAPPAPSRHGHRDKMVTFEDDRSPAPPAHPQDDVFM